MTLGRVLNLTLQLGLRQLQLGLLDRDIGLICRRLALHFGHLSLYLRILRGAHALQLLQHANSLLNDLRNSTKGPRRIRNNTLTRRRQKLVQLLLHFRALDLLELADVLTRSRRSHLKNMRGIPQRNVFLDVIQNQRNKLRGHQHRTAQNRRSQVVQMHLQVRKMVLLRKCSNRTTQRRSHVLVDRIHLLGLRSRYQQLLNIRNAQLLQNALFNLANVVNLRKSRCSLAKSLNLSKSLRFRENVGVRNRNHIHRAQEVRPLDQQLASLVLDLLVLQIHRIDTMQNLQRATHRIVQPSVNCIEYNHALLNSRQLGANRHVALIVGNVLQGGANNALTRINQKAKQPEQRLRRLVERQRHRNLANIVTERTTLNLLHLGRINALRLTTLAATLQLQHAGEVCNVCTVQQRTQSTRSRCRNAANHLRDANRIRTTPRHKRELNDPLHLLKSRIALLPVAVNAQNFAGRFVNRNDVRR